MKGDVFMALLEPQYAFVTGDADRITTTYTRLEVVDAFGGSYLALKTMRGISPVKNTTDENWQCLTNSGKTAYEYAKDGGYPGTEIDFNSDLAAIYGLEDRLSTI